jgi:hypothetical protein
MQNGNGTPTTVSCDLHDEVRRYSDDMPNVVANNHLDLSQIRKFSESLQRAQEYAQQDNPLGWCELFQITRLLQQAKPPGLDERTNVESQMQRQELNDIWQEVKDAQRQRPAINIMQVTPRLALAEEALTAAPPSVARARTQLLQARQSLARAVEGVGSQARGYVAIGVELLYLFAVPMGLLATCRVYGTSVKEVLADTLFHTPFDVFVWGFLGGICWCIYCASYWSKRRLFDGYHLGWYVAHPWLSAVLGGTISLLILGGLVSLNGPTATASEPRAVLLILMSFVAGFSTNRIWKLLDRNIRKLLGSHEKRDPGRPERASVPG